jgi:tRNA(Ile)-lysidine synthase
MRHSDTFSLITPEQISHTIPSNSTLIVGLSGGPDSVCLLHLLTQLKVSHQLTIIAAHLDHGWRAESAQDAQWCQTLCNKLNVTFVSSHASSLSLKTKYNGSKEEVGRNLRRAFFYQLAQEHQATAIMLAHHQDDQIETFFIRLLRGSSLAGLTSMKTHDHMISRPLLTYSKEQILHYLAHHQLDFLIDASNQSSNFLRNRIRNSLIPQLDTIDTRWQTTIPQTIKQLQTAYDFLDQHAQTTLQQISLDERSGKVLVAPFLTLHSALQHQILMQMLINQKIQLTASNALFTEILRFLTTGTKKAHTIRLTVQIIKEKNYFYFNSL